jgi:hypothetical protein
VPPGSILLLLYAMNEVVMKLAELNMLLNLRDSRIWTTTGSPQAVNAWRLSVSTRREAN